MAASLRLAALFPSCSLRSHSTSLRDWRQAQACAVGGRARAADVVRSLVDYLAPVLDEQGELAIVRQGVEDIIARGTGAAEQRRVRDKAMEGSPPEDLGLGAVVNHAVNITMRGAMDLSEVEAAPDLLRVRQS